MTNPHLTRASVSTRSGHVVADTTPTLSEGARVGAYRLSRQIGAGGMGAVWLAEHALLGRSAAIKVLHPSFSARADIVTRFFNEARAATAIADPGIVQIFDFGHHTDGSAYIVMELLDGETLHARSRRGISISEALRVMRQVASSLGAAHARGIVHRDLKPENIFLVRDPEVPGGERAKILDFGIAKLAGDPGLKTQTSALMGTPTFMSPEQCRGAGHVDQRSDVYSLGCVLFAILTGRPPFDAEGVGDIIVKHLTEPAPLTSSVAGGISPALDELIARCLEKDPACRFTSGTELAAAIGVLLAQPVTQPVEPRPPTPLATPAATTLSSSVASISPQAPSPKRWKIAMIGSGIAVTMTAIAAWASLDERSTAPIGEPPVKESATGAADPEPPIPSPKPEPDPQPALAPSVDERPDLARAVLRSALITFLEWAKTHRSSSCPTTRELAVDVNDPWGHPMVVTCTDQPSTQQIGVISAGPDGVFSTADDLRSWEVDPLISAGARWKPLKRAPPKPPEPKKTHEDTGSPNPQPEQPPKPPQDPVTPPKPKSQDPVTPPKGATCVDQNGIPVCR